MPSRIREMTTAALLAALMSAVSWAGVYVYQVPFTLQTLFVALAALLLSPAWAAYAMVTYLLVGIVGVPVFAGGNAGIGVLAGPTGGYLVAFVFAALLGSTFRTAARSALLDRFETHPLRVQAFADSLAIVTVIIVVGVLGSVWLAASAGLALGEALMIGAAPFILGDLVKGLTAGILAWTVRRAVRAGIS